MINRVILMGYYIKSPSKKNVILPLVYILLIFHSAVLYNLVIYFFMYEKSRNILQPQKSQKYFNPVKI